MSEIELKPCPFCGKAPYIVCEDNSYGCAMITCGDDNECPVDLTAWGDLREGETLEHAAYRWNTRVTQQMVNLADATISVTSFDGHCVRVDFETREEAERFAENLTQQRVGEWLPISSAPKDGMAEILVLCAETRRPFIARWNPDGDSWVDRSGALDSGDPSWKAHHLEVTGSWSSDGGWFQPNEVTHWMPLPAPPEGSEA